MAHAASGPAAARAPFACLSHLDDRVARLPYRRRCPCPASHFPTGDGWGLIRASVAKRETVGRHRSFPAGKQRLALRDDAAPAAQDLAPRSSERLVSDAFAGAARSIVGSGPPLAKAPGSREGVSP